MKWPIKLDIKPVAFPNGGGIKAVRDMKIKRALAEEAAKKAKKEGK